jgi:predicted aspartyl protease
MGMINARVVLWGGFALGLASTSLQATEGCQLVRIADWPVELVANHLIVPGTINGQRVGVMLDTGSGTMILRSAADRLGLVRKEARGSRAFGIGGATYVEVTTVDEFKLGELTRNNWRVAVAGERDLGASISVILGEDFLGQLDVEFDLPHNAVRLFEAKDCDGVVLAYWAQQAASQVDLVPYYDAGQWIVVPVRINGRPLSALLDSGSGTSVLDKPVAEQLGIRPDSPGVVAAGKGGGLGAKSVDYWIGPLQSFAIGNETINGTLVHFADLWKDATYTPIGSHLARKIDFTPALLLGADFLRAHRVLIARSQRKMYFTYEGGPVFAPKARDPAPPESPR